MARWIIARKLDVQVLPPLERAANTEMAAFAPISLLRAPVNRRTVHKRSLGVYNNASARFRGSIIASWN